MHIIAISSPAQGGKDMVKDVMLREWRSNFLVPTWQIKVVRFADPLKDMVSSYFGWDRDRLNHDVEFKTTPDPKWNDVTPRKAMQVMGTEMMREVMEKELGIKPFVDWMKRRLLTLSDTNVKYVVIPDARFHDEFEMLEKIMAHLIFCDPRPRINPINNVHPSERDMWEKKEWNHVIDTGGTIEKTEQMARDLAEFIHSIKE